MEHVTTGRRLVKSPPELWAELSDPAALARRLGELGEIRITRALPESAVAWEAEQASGVVEIESSGWGTRVSLSAAPRRAPAPAPPPPPARVETELRVVARDAIRVEIPPPAPAQPPAPPPGQPSQPAEADPPEVRRPGLLARLLRRPEAGPPPAADPPPPPPEPDPPPPPEVLELGVLHVAFASRMPERPAPPAGPPGLAGDELRAVLERALDDLGAAHHRPFSRG
jgi:hypothetical protein